MPNCLPLKSQSPLKLSNHPPLVSPIKTIKLPLCKPIWHQNLLTDFPTEKTRFSLPHRESFSNSIKYLKFKFMATVILFRKWTTFWPVIEHQNVLKNYYFFGMLFCIKRNFSVQLYFMDQNQLSDDFFVFGSKTSKAYWFVCECVAGQKLNSKNFIESIHYSWLS